MRIEVQWQFLIIFNNNYNNGNANSSGSTYSSSDAVNMVDS